MVAIPNPNHQKLGWLAFLGKMKRKMTCTEMRAMACIAKRRSEKWTWAEKGAEKQ